MKKTILIIGRECSGKSFLAKNIALPHNTVLSIDARDSKQAMNNILLDAIALKADVVVFDDLNPSKLGELIYYISNVSVEDPQYLDVWTNLQILITCDILRENIPVLAQNDVTLIETEIETSPDGLQKLFIANKIN